MDFQISELSHPMPTAESSITRYMNISDRETIMKKIILWWNIFTKDLQVVYQQNMWKHWDKGPRVAGKWHGRGNTRLRALLMDYRHECNVCFNEKWELVNICHSCLTANWPGFVQGVLQNEKGRWEGQSSAGRASGTAGIEVYTYRVCDLRLAGKSG